jgi:hypothetical protein
VDPVRVVSCYGEEEPRERLRLHHHGQPRARPEDGAAGLDKSGSTRTTQRRRSTLRPWFGKPAGVRYITRRPEPGCGAREPMRSSSRSDSGRRVPDMASIARGNTGVRGCAAGRILHLRTSTGADDLPGPRRRLNPKMRVGELLAEALRLHKKLSPEEVRWRSEDSDHSRVRLCRCNRNRPGSSVRCWAAVGRQWELESRWRRR